MNTAIRSVFAILLSCALASPALCALRTGAPQGSPPPDVDLGCVEFDRVEPFTPKDTLSVLTRDHNPEHSQGFVVVAAADGLDAISFDRLIGNTLTIDGFNAIEYSINAIDYRAVVRQGAPTDVDGDDIFDLNGEEYERTPAEIIVPRFIGVSDGPPVAGAFADGELILIGLSGGNKFSTLVDFHIYNDNEESFSAQFYFDCWARVPLLDITSSFGQTHLSGPDNDPEESLGNLETGWFRMRGLVATSSALDIPDPAIYGVYIEKLGSSFGSADLPFERGLQAGHILPRAVMGDNDEAAGLDPPPDYGATLARRRAASLLLFPEFDNRVGDHTILTVTNTDPLQGVDVHYVYYGKFGAGN